MNAEQYRILIVLKGPSGFIHSYIVQLFLIPTVYNNTRYYPSGRQSGSTRYDMDERYKGEPEPIHRGSSLSPTLGTRPVEVAHVVLLLSLKWLTWHYWPAVYSVPVLTASGEFRGPSF